MQQILICSGIDGTLIPNGSAVESPDARRVFSQIAAHRKICLAYVSGRNKDQVVQAIKDYDLPEPDFIIGDVGTTIYYATGGRWTANQKWQEEISRDWRDSGRREIIELLSSLESKTFFLQPSKKQGPYKISYFTSHAVDPLRLRNIIAGILGHHGIVTQLVFSRDDSQQRGLLDILPRKANKLLALRFLMIEERFDSMRTVFAGDSGNDLDALTSGLPAILVKNTASDVRQTALYRLDCMGMQDRLYRAKGGFMGMNGNYAAGVLEGLIHFFPETANWLECAHNGLIGLQPTSEGNM